MKRRPNANELLTPGIKPTSQQRPSLREHEVFEAISQVGGKEIASPLRGSQ